MSSKDTIPDDVTRHPRQQIVWKNVVIMTLFHGGALWGLLLVLTGRVTWQTILFSTALYVMSILGISAGAHRLWSHRSYKAKLPLRIMLAAFNNIAFQGSIFKWVRNHRVHHKHSDTDADPHNSNRGFFYSHMGWIFCQTHPDVIAKGRTIDLSDLEADPVIRIQRKYYLPMGIVSCLVLPSLIPAHFWNESLLVSFLVAALLRFCLSFNSTCLINSAAHTWGNRPYDKNIRPGDNILFSLLTIGEGFHNYHHTFPWDYSTSELGLRVDLTTSFINCMAWIGWAYDLNKVSTGIVKQRMKRTGDGSKG